MIFALLIALCSSAFAGVDDHKNQAKFFVKKGWYEDAELELEKAVALPEGQEDAEAWLMLAQVRFEQRDAAGAFVAAKEALEYAEDPEIRAQAEQFQGFLAQGFGILIVDAPYPGMQSRIQLERSSLLLDPEMKKFVNELALELTRPQELPLTIALPVGDYLVQGEAVTIASGEELRLALGMNQLGAKGFSALQVSRLELAAGVGLMLGERTSNMRPSLEVQAGFSQPVGPLIVGVVGDWALRSYVVPGAGTQVQPESWTAGFRVGKELMVAGPLAVRPSLGYRYGVVPGIPLDCTGLAEGDLQCGAPSEISAPDVHIFAAGRAHIPFAELSIDWRRAGRTTAPGLGVRMTLDHARGSVEDPSSATLVDQPGQLDYQTADPRWSSTQLRMLAHFSYAF